MKFSKKLSVILLTIVFVFSTIAGCSQPQNGAINETDSDNSPVKVGWPNDTEPAVLGHIVQYLLEDNNIPVETIPGLGGTGIAHDGIIAGEIDIYVDYTGDALANVLKQDVISDPQKSYEACKEGFLEEYDIIWLKPTPFNNTYALALKEDIAEEYGITKISDLEQKASEWNIGMSIEFSKRPLDGYEGMVKCYGFEFGQITPMDSGLMYTAADQGNVNVIVAFATDARIGKFDLRILEDDKRFFPSYNAAPTVRNEALEMYPEIEGILNEVFTQLDTETMIALNGQVDMDNRNPETVAKEYLQEKGFIE